MQLSEFFHLIHVVDDEDQVDKFYDELFAPDRFSPRHWSPHEMRWASLSMVSDLMLEVIEASSEPDHQSFPLSRFHQRFGQHFHSLAWYVELDQVRATFDGLRAAGIRVAKPGGGIWPSEGDVEPGNTLFTHPKDTCGQLEFEGKFAHWQTHDPRFQPGWSAAPWRNGPLGIRRLSHMTTVVRDLGRAVELYEGVLGGQVLHRESADGADRAFVLTGIDTVIELAQPTAPAAPGRSGPATPLSAPAAPGRSGPGPRLAADLDANGELPHSATFRVVDLEAAERHTDKLGIRVADRSGDTLTLDPDDCYGAVWSFTERAIPGDPRAVEA